MTTISNRTLLRANTLMQERPRNPFAPISYPDAELNINREKIAQALLKAARDIRKVARV